MKKAKLQSWLTHWQQIPWKRIQKSFLYWCRHPKTPWFLAFLILVIVIFYQQSQLTELQGRIDAMNNFSDKDSFAYRVYNQEYITDSHSRDIYKMKLKQDDMAKDIWYLQSTQNNLEWRVMMLEWNNPTSSAK